ncbi:KAP family NTPase [Prevotella sp. E15-22]|uniref:KAP family P-loop NTPase fold protein n=1 Tax=Prevotella sp. E15-22 TaxID=2937774 RepID=UPI00206EA683|nr:P-loop NTPase fold protein [Prevotella sp. E15-22]UPS43457.1 KAP family NTPase [Prevotella sp. E15-22]
MLRNRLPEIEIPYDNPFQNDKLNRKSCADTFCSLVKMYSDTGCVVALNGDWGMGKTTFVRMLMQKMEKEHAHPLYFNAWENDYVSDPLIALLAELKVLSPQSSKWNNVVACGAKVLTSAATSAVKTIVKNKLGIDSDAFEAGADEIEKLLKDDIEEFSKQKTSFAEFRKALQNYIAENTTEDYPVVFFVDELDRCNPRFSVHVLERIKHLFDIPNVVFVLSINKKQLGYAVQGYFGSANIDADNYLRRFIDIEYSLPQPDREEFCQYLYHFYCFDEVFGNKDRKHNTEFQSEGDNFLQMAKILLSSSKIDLRTIDKVMAHTRLALMEFGKNNYIIPDVYFLLCYLKIVKPELYRQIVDTSFTAQQLLTELESYFPRELLVMDVENTAWRQMAHTIASLVYMYTLNFNGIEREQIIDPKNNMASVLKTTCIDQRFFDETLSFKKYRIGWANTPLHFLIKRIELEQGFVTY